MSLIRGDAAAIPLADSTVDLIVTSPPYFALREYRDDGEVVAGQIGSEATPTEFLRALWHVADECWRVLKPTGVMCVNLGDKYAGSGGHNNAGLSTAGSTLQGARQQARTGCPPEQRRQAPRRYNQAADAADKSLEGLPWRYVLGLSHPHLYRAPFDRPGPQWVHRSELIWDKPNCIPESADDRPSRTHEQWFLLTKEGRYYSALDELREPRDQGALGARPRSVWTIPSEPLSVPDWLGVDHFAAFPQEWPRRLILGFSPPAVCTTCGEGRRPGVDTTETSRVSGNQRNGRRDATSDAAWAYQDRTTTTTILGYVCSCCPHTIHRDRSKPTSTPGREKHQDQQARIEAGEPRRHGDDWPKRQPRTEWHLDEWTPPPSTPGVVLDPFTGTGTVPMVARALGRVGIGIDLSADYLRLATWRINQSGHAAKTEARTWAERQQVLL